MPLWRSGRSQEGKATQVDGKAVGLERAVSREHSRRPGAHFTEKRLLLYPRRCWRGEHGLRETLNSVGKLSD